jgi:hypothetical protein
MKLMRIVELPREQWETQGQAKMVEEDSYSRDKEKSNKTRSLVPRSEHSTRQKVEEEIRDAIKM